MGSRADSVGSDVALLPKEAAEDGTREGTNRAGQKDHARKSAALRSRREPSVPAQLALDGLDRQLRRKWHCRRDPRVLARICTNVFDIGVPSDGGSQSQPKP